MLYVTYCFSQSFSHQLISLLKSTSKLPRTLSPSLTGQQPSPSSCLNIRSQRTQGNSRIKTKHGTNQILNLTLQTSHRLQRNTSRRARPFNSPQGYSSSGPDFLKHSPDLATSGPQAPSARSVLFIILIREYLSRSPPCWALCQVSFQAFVSVGQGQLPPSCRVGYQEVLSRPVWWVCGVSQSPRHPHLPAVLPESLLVTSLWVTLPAHHYVLSTFGHLSAPVC